MATYTATCRTQDCTENGAPKALLYPVDDDGTQLPRPDLVICGRWTAQDGAVAGCGQPITDVTEGSES